ncbi:MAG: DNA repair protein RadA [candidate division FCPU426 bacterium]
MSARQAKAKLQFVCQACGQPSPKWLGRCPACGAWNSFAEERQAARPSSAAVPAPSRPPLRLNEVSRQETGRLRTGLEEFDRVLGGGLVPGSLVLIGGDPGIGKSTLLLQAVFSLAQSGLPVLYVSGEESAGQISLRAGRLGSAPDSLWLLCETRVDEILGAIAAQRPAVVVVDSIQTLTHPDQGAVPGSVSQIRECGQALLACAKADGPAILLVGHVTKEGVLAGPRVLEHLVDTVLYFEGDRQQGYRVLRTVKNRFGSTNEVGLFEMTASGLQAVPDPSRWLLKERHPGAAGSAVAVSLEGTRPLLVEIQALTATAYFGMPQRRVSGLDYNRCCLLLAVLERRAGISVGGQDVFLSVAGGLSVTEPAVDLAVALAVASSLKDQPLPPSLAVMGEVSLGGDIRAVSQAERRCREAQQLGFQRCLVPGPNLADLKTPPGMDIVGVATLAEALAAVRG